MTQEDWKLILPFVQAGADGKKLEIKINGSWYQASGNADMTTLIKWVKSGELRIAPEPTFVQWADDEVPLDAWYRRKRDPSTWSKIDGRSVNSASVPLYHFGDYRISAADLLVDREHSTDGCKTWKPCGKEVVK